MIATFNIHPYAAKTAKERAGLAFNRSGRFSCTPRHIGAAVFLECEIKVPMTEAKRRQRLVRYALRRLKKMGVHKIVSASDVEKAAQENAIITVSPHAAWRAAAGQAALAAIASKGASLQNCCVQIIAEKVTADVTRTANLLAAKARYVIVGECRGAQKLRQALHENYGMAQVGKPPEGAYIYNLNMDAPPKGFVMSVPKNMAHAKPKSVSDEAYAAMLFEMGLVLPEEIIVKKAKH